MSRQRPGFRVFATIVWAANAVPAAVNFIEQPHLPQVVGVSSGRTQLSSLVSSVLSAIVLLACFVVILSTSRGRVRAPVHQLLLALSPCLLVLLQLAFQRSLDAPSLLTIGSCIVVILAVWLSAPTVREVAFLGWLGAATIVLSLGLAVFNPGHAVFVDQYGNSGKSTKSLIGADQVAGILGHSNTLGVVAVLTIAILLYQRRSVARNVLIVLSLIALLLASSRTAFIALSVMVVFAVWSRLVLHRGRPLDWLVASVAVVVVALPLTASSGEAFTGRGRIWMGALNAAGHSWLVGYGPDWFTRVGLSTQELGSEAGSGHNMFVHLFVTGGAIALAVYAFLFFGLIRRMMRQKSARATALYRGVLSVLLSIAMLEFAWTFDIRSDVFMLSIFLVVSLVLVSPSEDRLAESPAHSPVGGSEDRVVLGSPSRAATRLPNLPQ